MKTLTNKTKILLGDRRRRKSVICIACSFLSVFSYWRTGSGWYLLPILIHLLIYFSFLMHRRSSGSTAVTYFHENSIAGPVPRRRACQRFHPKIQIKGITGPRWMGMGEITCKPLRQGTCRSLFCVNRDGRLAGLAMSVENSLPRFVVIKRIYGTQWS